MKVVQRQFHLFRSEGMKPENKIKGRGALRFLEDIGIKAL